LRVSTERRRSGIDVLRRAHLYDLKLYPDGRSSALKRPQVRVPYAGVPHDCDTGKLWDDASQQLEPFCREVGRVEKDSRDVSPRPAVTLGIACCQRVGSEIDADDWDLSSRRGYCTDRPGADGIDDVDLESNQLGRTLGEFRRLPPRSSSEAVRPSIQPCVASPRRKISKYLAVGCSVGTPAVRTPIRGTLACAQVSAGHTDAANNIAVMISALSDRCFTTARFIRG